MSSDALSVCIVHNWCKSGESAAHVLSRQNVRETRTLYNMYKHTDSFMLCSKETAQTVMGTKRRLKHSHTKDWRECTALSCRVVVDIDDMCIRNYRLRVRFELWVNHWKSTRSICMCCKAFHVYASPILIYAWQWMRVKCNHSTCIIIYRNASAIRSAIGGIHIHSDRIHWRLAWRQNHT